MKKFLIVVLVILVIAVGIVVIAGMDGGISTSKAFSFNVNTGDKIKVSLNTSDGYDIDSNIPFNISKDGENLSQGTFITMYGYNEYMNLAASDSSIKVLDSGSRSDIEYTFYTVYNSNEKCSEYNYIIKVKDSNTGLLIGNIVSESSAKDVFDNLTFTKE